MDGKPSHRSRRRLTRPPFKNDALASGPLAITCAILSVGFLGGGVTFLAHGHAIGVLMLAAGLAFPLYLVHYFRLPPLPKRKDE